MAYKIIDVEGIGEVYSAKLIEVGINSVEQLLESSLTKKARAELAEKTGISEALILKWANHADLFRIKGVAGQYSELLEAAGVDTVKELRTRNAANLAAKMAELNETKHLCKRTPAEKEIAKYIGLAQKLEPVVTY
jgi:predicted flap endonuclease-1-like 5' DNA nuclease